MALTLVVAAISVIVPVRGVRQKIRRTKLAELEAIEAELREARAASLGRDAAAAGRLTDLLNYRAYVNGLPEWPFDAPALARLALYLLIPLGSWFGGAFVERLVGAALD